MWDFSCECLNVKLRVAEAKSANQQQGNGSEGNKMQDDHLRENAKRVYRECAEFRVPENQAQLLRDPFLAEGNCKILKSSDTTAETQISIQFPALVACRSVGQDQGQVWVIARCLICDTDTWGHRRENPALDTGGRRSLTETQATLRFKPGTEILIGAKLLSETDFEKAMDSVEFSPAIGLAWPKNRETPAGLISRKGDETENKNSSSNSSSSMDQEILTEGEQILEKGFSGKMAQSEAAQQIIAACADYLRREQEAMDVRVRSFIEMEASNFEAKRKKAKADRDLILRELDSKTMILDDILGLARQTERQNSGGSANDSAVPLSPVSLTSLEQSPGATTMNGLAGLKNSGTGKNRASMGQPEESLVTAGEEDLFTFDEDHIDGFSERSEPNGPPGTPGYLPADDEGETDDSGTGEDYSKYYPPYSDKGKMGKKQGVQAAQDNSGATRDVQKSAAVNTGLVGKFTEGIGPLAFGTSMPVKIPNKFWPPKEAENSVHPSEASSSDEENDEFLLHRAVVNKRRGTTGSGGVAAGRRPHDMAASMRALAASVQPANDPERLFGEFPQRRRYKTGAEAVRMRAAAGNGAAARVQRQVFPDAIRPQ